MSRLWTGTRTYPMSGMESLDKERAWQYELPASADEATSPVPEQLPED